MRFGCHRCHQHYDNHTESNECANTRIVRCLVHWHCGAAIRWKRPKHKQTIAVFFVAVVGYAAQVADTHLPNAQQVKRWLRILFFHRQNRKQAIVSWNPMTRWQCGKLRNNNKNKTENVFIQMGAQSNSLSFTKIKHREKKQVWSYSSRLRWIGSVFAWLHFWEIAPKTK